MSATRPTHAAARLLAELRDANVRGDAPEVARLARDASRAGATRDEVRLAMGLPAKQGRASGVAPRAKDDHEASLEGAKGRSEEAAPNRGEPSGIVPTKRRPRSDPKLLAAGDAGPAWLAESTHELSNAVTAISFIARKSLEVGDAEAALARIIAVCDDAVDALRHFRASSPPPPREPPRADVGIVFDDVRAAMMPMAHAANVRFGIHATADLVAGMDPSALRSVVWNLAKNAIEAVGPDGNVDVSATEDDRGVHLVVADDGPGLSASELARVLEPFATTRADGMGLGLPIVRRLVTEHGGALSFDSGPGAGTRVHVTLPLVTSSDGKRTSGIERRPSAGGERARPTSARARSRRG